MFDTETLFNQIEKPLESLVHWAYQESVDQKSCDDFIKGTVEEKNALLKQASRLDCITEIKQNLIMYRWLIENLADDLSRNILKALMARRLFNSPELEQYADSAYANIITPLTPIHAVQAIADCGGDTEALLSFLNSYPDKKVFFFEPDNNNFFIAKRRLKSFKNIVYSMCGAYSRSAVFKTQNGESAEFIALDEKISGDLDLVRLDCNGLELYAIEGMRRHMQKRPPIFSVNVSCSLDAVWQVPYRIRLLQLSCELHLRYDGKCVNLYTIPSKDIGSDIINIVKSAAPSVTVFTCAYNTPEHQIRRAIESVIFQTYRDFEYIIVDNGCTDETRGIIREYADAYPGIRLFRLEQNSIGDAWKLMLEKAKGKFLVILDSDDYYEPHFLQIMADEQSRTEADIVACGSRGESNNNPFSRGIRSFRTPAIDLKDLGDIWPDVFCLLSSIWAKFLRLSIYRAIKTDYSAGTGTDTLYILLYLKHCRLISFSGDVLHVYLQTEKTASRQFDSSALQHNKVIFSQANAFLESTGNLSERNYTYNCHVFLSSIKRSVRFTANAFGTSVSQRILFLEDILNDRDVNKALIFIKQAEPFYAEMVDAQRRIAKCEHDGEALLLADARNDMLKGQNEHALKKLLVLSANEGLYCIQAQANTSRMLKGHALLTGYASWMTAYPDAATAVFSNQYDEATKLLIDKAKTDTDILYADDIFELLLSLTALNGDSSSFVYIKKLRLHYEVVHDNREKAVPLIEELNELCPLDRMVLYYTLQFFLLLGQKEDAEALTEGAKQYYPDDPLLQLQENLKSVSPYPDGIAR